MTQITSLENIGKVSLSGSLDEGGWTASLTATESGDLYVPDRLLTLGVMDYLSGTWDADFELLFRGVIEAPAVNTAWIGGETSQTVHTSQYHLKNGWLRATRFFEAATSQNRHRVPQGTLTSEYVLRHLLLDHTNLKRLSGINIESGGYTYRDITFQDMKFWEAIDYLARAELKMMYFDKRNTFNYRSHPAFLANIPEAVMTFTEDYMRDAPTFTNYPQRVAQAQCFGFTDELVEIASFYPANQQDSIGEVVEYPSLRVASQADLDALAARLYAWGNRNWSGEIPMALNHNLDLGDVVALTYSDIPNGIDFSAMKFLITAMSFDIDIGDTKWEGSITVEEIPSTYSGV